MLRRATQCHTSHHPSNHNNPLPLIHTILGSLQAMLLPHRNSQSTGHYSESQTPLVSFPFLYQPFTFQSCPWLYPPSKILIILDSSQSPTDSNPDSCSLDSSKQLKILFWNRSWQGIIFRGLV